MEVVEMMDGKTRATRGLGAAPLWLVTVLACTVALPARAQEASAPSIAPASEEDLREARALFELGHAHYDAGRYADAAREFQRAYDLSRRPELLYNLHLAYRDSGDTVHAVEALRGYLAGAEAVDPTLQRTLERRLTAMDATLAADHASAPEPTTAPDPVTPPDPPALVEPDVEPSTSHEPARELASAASPIDTGMGLEPGAVILAIGGASLVVAAITGGIAASTLGERDATCNLGASGSDCPAAYDQASIVDRFTVQRDAAWGLFWAGLGAAAIGAVLLVVGATDDHAALTAGCDPAGCTAILTGVL